MNKKRVIGFVLGVICFINPFMVKALDDGWVVDGDDTYYYQNGEMYKGILELVDGDYLLGYMSGKLYRNSLAKTPEGKEYLTDENGKIKYDFQNYNGKTYYFTKEGMYKGILELEDGDYLLGYNSGFLYRDSLAKIPDGREFLTDENGKIKYDFQNYKNDTYYFTKEGMYKGILETENGNYLFGFVSGKLYKNGWAKIPDGNLYYTNKDGIINHDHLVLDGIDYDFTEDGKLKTGWQYYNNKYYYLEFGDYNRVKGFKTIDNSVYFFDKKTAERVSGEREIDHNNYNFAADGKLLSVKYNLSVYYSQKDSRWANNVYGLSNISKSGCAPTSMAMAFSSILGKEILPTDVANYLYRNTNEYNKRTKGSSGMAIVYATDHFKVKRTPLRTKNELSKALENGKIVFAAMGNGYFGTKQWNHAIVMAGYKNNTTFVQDPLTKTKNKWYSIDDIWSQRSKDADDQTGGAYFYSLERYFN